MANGSTAIDGRSGSGSAGLRRVSLAGAALAAVAARCGPRPASAFVARRAPCQLALEKRGQILVVLEGLGLAAGGRQRLHDQPVRVLAHVVERDRALAGLQRLLAAACRQLLLAEPDQRAERQSFSRSRSPVSQSFQASSLMATSSRKRSR